MVGCRAASAPGIFHVELALSPPWSTLAKMIADAVSAGRGVTGPDVR
jgi:hypothetical protein